MQYSPSIRLIIVSSKFLMCALVKKTFGVNNFLRHSIKKLKRKLNKLILVATYLPSLNSGPECQAILFRSQAGICLTQYCITKFKLFREAYLQNWLSLIRDLYVDNDDFQRLNPFTSGFQGVDETHLDFSLNPSVTDNQSTICFMFTLDLR